MLHNSLTKNKTSYYLVNQLLKQFMKLVNIETKKPIVEFVGKKTLIHNKFLEEEMKILGIPIPDGLRGLYAGQDTIHLDDDKFQEAFKQVYFISYMDPRHFKWEE